MAKLPSVFVPIFENPYDEPNTRKSDLQSQDERLETIVAEQDAEWDAMVERNKQAAQAVAASAGTSPETPTLRKKRKKRRTKAEMAAVRAKDAEREAALAEQVTPEWLKESWQDWAEFDKRLEESGE